TCSKAIAIFREQHIRRGEGWALRAMGDIARERHHNGDAREYYEDALAIFSSLGDRVDQARVMNCLGAISFDDGEHLEAKEYYEQALALDQRLGHPARKDMQDRVDLLVKEHDLDEIYEQLSRQYGLD
ncbi:MAG: tetratricopeptide repeat protein, partial [Chloroflexi bacterium]